MKILVANLGSTSFKYRLFDMAHERQLARGGTERIGAAESKSFVEIGGGQRQEIVGPVPDHAVAVQQCLKQLTDPQQGCLTSADEVAGIGFKAVHGGRFSGVQRVNEEVLAEMEAMNQVAPAHNPPYVAAMRLLNQKLPNVPLIAAFETDFHQSIPDRHALYAVPHAWAETCRVRRWGFHGASHRYIAVRMAEILGRGDLRIISCHLGGSASLCAIRAGASQANSLGMSPQTGLPHNNRVGDFDVFALPVIMRETGLSLDDVLKTLANKSGLAGLSDTSGDMRDVEESAAAGSAKARQAIEVFVGSVRSYLGAYLVELGGADAIVFTGGMGEKGVGIREQICAGLDELGITLDRQLNQSAKDEAAIHAATSRVQLWVVPTNEEIIVARLSAAKLKEA